jgi:NTP pyrophosphatase (non-canonical NTP hydrolase)
MIPTLKQLDDRLAFSSVNDIALYCADLSEQKGFHDRTMIEGVSRRTSAMELMMLIVTEVAEMAEAYRKDRNTRSAYLAPGGKPEGVASELADVVIRCLDYAGRYGIDIGYAIQDKLAYNATRAHRHGKLL